MPTNNVLILGTSLSGGGAEYVTSVMIRTITNSTGVLFENNAKLSLSDNRTYIINNFVPKNWLAKLVVNIFRLLYIQVVKIIFRPKITISHLEGPNFINLITFFGGRRVIFIHNSLSKNYRDDTFTNKAKKLLAILLYRRANIVAGVSTEICNEINMDYGVTKDRIMCLKNPVDIRHIRRRSCNNFNDWRRLVIDEKYILNVASFTDQKNHKFLIDIYRHALNIGIDLRLLLVGDGPRKREMIEYCETLGIYAIDLTVNSFNPNAKILFVGYQENPYPFYLGAKLFLMPSLWEGYPISLLEAFAFGVPAIVSNCSSGIRDIFDVDDEETISEQSVEFKTTRYGHLIYTFENSNAERPANIWARSIKEILRNNDYYASCSTAAKLKAESCSVIPISEIWEREFDITCIKLST